MSKPSSKPRNTLERALRRPPEGDDGHPTLEAPPPTEGENTESRLARRVDAFLNTLVADQSGIVCDIEASPGATIAPRGRSSTERDAALQRLRDRKSVPVKLEGLLGEGGMGAVYLAEQTSLARKVAVKKIRAEVMSDDAVLKLLQEAWVTGHLEHPNIIPVYDIHTDAQGHPEIVLKRIDGVEWGELMFDAATVRRRFGAKDLLEWNLGVLMHVCDALHFAHRRGILHRDVKPENILIGELGEIYLADWGIAVGLDETHRDIIPLAANVTHMAGTPCYMAPEMLGGDESRLGPATDVYLLGSVLYEVLAERPPHEGEKMRDIVASIIVGPPPLPEHVAPELARIVERAQATDPDARFENPLQLRLALEGFLRHRGARSLAEHAEARRLEFTTLAEDYAARFAAEAGDQAEDPTGAEASEARTKLETSFAECRFGFREAIKQWPGNQPAKEGLARALTTMIEHELRIGDAKAARSLLTSFDDAVPPSEELASRVHVAEDEAKREAARVAQLERLYDERTGMRTRTFIAALLGAVWVVLPVAMYFLQRGMDPNDAPDFRVVIAVPVVMLVLMTGLVIWARETFTSTVLNRRYAASLFYLFLVQLGLAFFVQAEQWSLHRTGIAHFAWWGIASGFGAILLDLRFMWAAAAYLVSVPLVIANPYAFYPCASLCNLLVTVIMVKMGLPVLRDDLQRRLAERAERRSG